MENFYINSITEKLKIILTNEKSFEILLFPFNDQQYDNWYYLIVL
jgi:hypothetical protein